MYAGAPLDHKALTWGAIPRCGRVLTLQRKVTSYATPYSGQIDALCSQFLKRCFPMSSLGGGGVVAGVADLPCGLLQQTLGSSGKSGMR